MYQMIGLIIKDDQRLQNLLKCSSISSALMLIYCCLDNTSFRFINYHIYKQSQIKLEEFNKVKVSNYIRLIVNLHVESFMKTLHGLEEYDVICTHKMGAVVGPPLFNLIPEILSSNNSLSIIVHSTSLNRMNNYGIRDPCLNPLLG